jgi:nitroreductase
MVTRNKILNRRFVKEANMEFSDLIEKRYSVRAYKPDPVEDEVLNQVLEAARLAPTATNAQPFQLIVIHTAGREAELNRIYRKDWFVQAPLVICICGIPAEGWVRRDGKNYTEVDVAIAMDHLILAATDVGLGTCWIGAFYPAAAREVLGLPDGVEPIAFTPLGYPADQPRPKKRKALSELVCYERW